MQTLVLQRVGSVAADIITQSDGTEADVLAVFDRSFYVLTEYGFVCIAKADIGDGPINARLRAEDAVADWTTLGVYPDAKVHIAGGRLMFGDVGAVELNATPVWMPPDWQAPVAGWSQTAARVQEALVAAAPQEGLARIVCDAARRPATDVERAAEAPAVALRGGLKDVLRDGLLSDAFRRAMTLLVGLGPGLTPSGDDVLGGMFLALSALGHEDIRDQMWEAIGPELDMLTVPISAMHLACAADGLGAAALHDLINGVLARDEAAVDAALPRVLAIGATSGADAVAGMSITFAAHAALAGI